MELRPWVLHESHASFFGSTVSTGKEPHHKGHKVHKGVKSLDCSHFSSPVLAGGARVVTVVSIVFEKGFPLI
jgi:hypothetical protein